MRFVSTFVLGVLLVSLPTLARADASITASPTSCASAEDIVRAVHATAASFAEIGRNYVVDVVEGEGATIDVLAGDQRLGQREFRAPASCSVLTQAVAAILVALNSSDSLEELTPAAAQQTADAVSAAQLAAPVRGPRVEAQAQDGEPQPTAVPSTESELAASPETAEPETAEPEPSTTSDQPASESDAALPIDLSLAFGLSIRAGVTPGLGAGPGALVSLSLGRFALRVPLSYQSSSQEISSVPVVGVNVSAWTIGARACYSHPYGSWRFDGCAAADVAAVDAQGVGYPRTNQPSLLQLSFGGEIAAEYRWRFLMARLAAGVSAPTSSIAFVTEDGLTARDVPYAQSDAFGSLSLVVGVRWGKP